MSAGRSRIAGIANGSPERMADVQADQAGPVGKPDKSLQDATVKGE